MIDEERLAKALALAHISADMEPAGDEQESVESIYGAGTSWLDVDYEWYETPRTLAQWTIAQYERLAAKEQPVLDDDPRKQSSGW